jgi:hypothetical protein
MEEVKEEKSPPDPPLRPPGRKLLKSALPATLAGDVILSSTNILPALGHAALPLAAAYVVQLISQAATVVLRRYVSFGFAFSFSARRNEPNNVDDKKLKVVQ